MGAKGETRIPALAMWISDMTSNRDRAMRSDAKFQSICHEASRLEAIARLEASAY